MNDVQNELRRCRRLFGRLVGCVGLFLVFVVDCRGSRVALGAPPEESYITVRNPRALPPRISAERIPLGISGDYKPSLALLPDGDLRLVMFHQVDKGGGKVREDMIHFRSADGGKTWGERQVLPLLGREPYFSVLRDGTLFLTTHLSSRDVLNPEGYVHSYVHRSADGGKTWDKSLVCTVEGFDVKKQGFPWHAETVFWQAGNGDILAIARCHSGALPALGNTEIPEGNDNVERMALFRSRNGGKTWTLEPEMGNDYAEHYQAVLRLQDQRLLFTFTVRGLRPPLGLRAVLGTENPDGFLFDFKSNRLVLDERTPADKPSGGGFGNTVQLPSGQLVSAYTYRGEDGNVHAEVLRWALPPYSK